MFDKKLCVRATNQCQLIMSLRLTLNGTFTMPEAIGIIKEFHNDCIVHPQDKQFYATMFTSELIDGTNREFTKEFDDLLDNSIYRQLSINTNIERNTTSISILLLTGWWDNDDEENEDFELIYKDLQKFVEYGHCLSFEQLEANPCEVEKKILDSREIRADIRTNAKTSDAPWTVIDICDAVENILEITLDHDDTDLFCGLLAYYNHCHDLDIANRKAPQ